MLTLSKLKFHLELLHNWHSVHDINMFLYAIQLKMQTTLANKNIDKKAQVLICGDTVFLYESNEIEKINESLKNGVLKKCKIPNAYE